MLVAHFVSALPPRRACTLIQRSAQLIYSSKFVYLPGNFFVLLFLTFLRQSCEFFLLSAAFAFHQTFIFYIYFCFIVRFYYYTCALTLTAPRRLLLPPLLSLSLPRVVRRARLYSAVIASAFVRLYQYIYACVCVRKFCMNFRVVHCFSVHFGIFFSTHCATS